MRKVLLLICKNISPQCFATPRTSNQLKSYKDYSSKGFACKGNELFSNCQINFIKKACSLAG